MAMGRKDSHADNIAGNFYYTQFATLNRSNKSHLLLIYTCNISKQMTI